MATFTRQPFGDITSSRLQALGSSKNRQNALSPSSPSFACPLKPSAPASIGKRRREPDIFEDDDSENIAPASASTPTKKSRTSSHALVKPARFSVAASPARSSASLTASPAPSISSVRKSVSSPNTARSTPISHSRGSPKNKRLNAVSKRRASSSPFRRVDPPSFSHSALPFSIDAALSGTISSYTPKSTTPTTPSIPSIPAVSVTPPAPQAAALDESMPKGWFFEIHEDTPEQEAANLMEHSASVLDISSDDDAETKAKIEELSRGKENVPPPDFALVQPRSASAHAIDDGEETEIEEPVKRPRMRKIPQDAMDEDRRPLGDLPPSEFYGKGCHATSYVTVDAGIERPSRLSNEVNVESEDVDSENVDSENVDPENVDPENVDPVKKIVQPAPVIQQVAYVEEATTPPVKGSSPTPQTTPQPIESPAEQQ